MFLHYKMAILSIRIFQNVLWRIHARQVKGSMRYHDLCLCRRELTADCDVIHDVENIQQGLTPLHGIFTSNHSLYFYFSSILMSLW